MTTAGDAGTTIGDRWKTVRARVAAACERAGRSPADVTIIAVSKKHGPEAVREAVAAGATDFGENYAQELAAKLPECPPNVRWHFIGRLQRNKVKLVAGHVALVHAVDSVELATELAKRTSAVQPILLAINAAGEGSKGGVTLESALALARAVTEVPHVRLDGLMTMPPPSAGDPEASRPHFEAVRALRDQLANALGQPLPLLSMGMSDDFEVAIACGSTHVRIGTAIFGPRG